MSAGTLSAPRLIACSAASTASQCPPLREALHGPCRRTFGELQVLFDAPSAGGSAQSAARGHGDLSVGRVSTPRKIGAREGATGELPRWGVGDRRPAECGP